MIHPVGNGQDVDGIKVFVGDGVVVSVETCGVWALTIGVGVAVITSCVLVGAGASGI